MKHNMISENTDDAITDKKTMSVPRMLFLFIFFLIFAVGVLMWSIPHIYHWAQSMWNYQPALIFSKKKTALLGCGIAMLFCAVRIVILKERVYQLDKLFIAVIALSFFIMFIFPSIMESVVESYVKEHHYGYCAGASFKGQDCYTIDEQTCRIETAKREQMLKDFWGEE